MVSVMKKTKKRAVKPRAWVVENMIVHCKPGAHKDKKREADKTACRSFRKDVDEIDIRETSAES
jgi:hypothetical protein